MPTLVYHCSRVSPALVAGSSITGRLVAEVLDGLGLKGIRPDALDVDNGPESISRVLDAWAYRNKVKRELSPPSGKPTDNAPIEGFNARLRAECLSRHEFANLREAQEVLEAFCLDYNTD